MENDDDDEYLFEREFMMEYLKCTRDSLLRDNCTREIYADLFKKIEEIIARNDITASEIDYLLPSLLEQVNGKRYEYKEADGK